MAPGAGGGEHSQQVDLRGRGRRLGPRICCCRRDSRPQGRHLRHHAYKRCARYVVGNWRITQIAKWDFLQAVRQQVARRPPARVQVWNDQSPQPTSYCYGCHHGCNPGLKLPSCSFEEDNCGWNSVIELNATKWFRFQRLTNINRYIGSCSKLELV